MVEVSLRHLKVLRKKIEIDHEPTVYYHEASKMIQMNTGRLETTCRTVNSSTTRCFDWCARNRFSIKHNKTRDCAGTATWCEKWDVKETCK
ncbi:Translation initiation factor IF-2 [Dirofilaria immitis]